MKDFDTIAAIATSIGESGISIIRVSGSNSLKIVGSAFVGKNNRGLEDIKTYSMRYGHIIDNKFGEIIDEVIITYMKAPKSFTAEDTVEINCHGGIVVTRRVLEEILKLGARLAEPGEFTKRAFLNGRIDLSQAEAVIDIIRAKTELSAKSAIMQSDGRVSREILRLRTELLKTIAHIEATVDYPEDDLEQITSDMIEKDLNRVIGEIDIILETADAGKIVRDGLNTVIVGKPNVGKSSLLNALLMENRAIVTDIPGTTRDVIEEFINIDGIPIKISDTAGIRETEDVIEKYGVERSKKKIDEADLIIFMLDVSRVLDKDDLDIIQYIKNKKYIVLLNKSDLDVKIDMTDLKDLSNEYTINTSALTGEGIDKLKIIIKNLFFNGEVTANSLMITNDRHKDALIKAKECCIDALDVLKSTLAIDMASIDIRNAWKMMGEITGDTLDSDLIDKIFSEFCLGK